MTNESNFNSRLLLTLAQNDPEFPAYAASLPHAFHQETSIPPEKLNDLLAAVQEDHPELSGQIDRYTAGHAQGSPMPQKRFLAGDITTITAVLAAALFLLRTHIKIERSSSGKWSFLMEHRPESSGIIKKALDTLAGLVKQLPGGDA